jgi:energy-coupling factor transport system permease protein
MAKINLRTVLILVVCLTGISVIYQQPVVQLILLALTLLLLLISKPSPSARQQLLIRLSHLGKIIFIIFIMQLLFRRSGEALFEFGFIRITDIGLNYALASSLRFFIIILVAGLLMDYPFQDYLIALNAWKFPYEISFIVAATIHFLPVFKETFNQKTEALALRGIALDNLSLKNRFIAYKTLVLPVLASALHNIQFRAISLELRAFRLYPKRTFLHRQKLAATDLLIISFTLAATAFTIISL